jgi:uncharacterized protein (TIGR03435 family)
MKKMIGLIALTACGQSFEVASIKPGKPPAQSTMARSPGGERFIARNMPLLWLIGEAYQVSNRQISGLPPALNDGYDIEAKADRPVSRDQMMLMLRSLLEDRFKLVVRRETRELRTHVLVVAKGGAKMDENRDGTDLFVRKVNASQSTYHNVSMPVLASFLAFPLDDTVVDRTELKGTYDFKLDYMPDHLGPGVLEGREPGPNPNAPPLETALEQQLGLKLESRKSPVEMLIVEHIEKLSVN